MAKIKQATKKTGRERKEVIVAELVQKLDNSTGLVFTDYKGITHRQLEDLKRELKKLDSTIIIAKNSLLKISMEKSKNYADFKDNDGLNEPTATLFIEGDMVEALKKLQKSFKDNGLPKIKFGILEGNLTDEAGVLKIAALPSRETLIAQFVGMLNSPIQGFVSGLNAIPTKFVMTLDAIAKAKPADNTPAPAAETPAETETPVTEAPADGETQTEDQPAAPDANVPEAPVETDENVESAEPAAETSEAEAQPTEAETPTEEQKNEGGEE